ncbi:uncharacterized protein LOC100903142 [Galendromus occidentalis]|uniref:Uncharacterized protein LOC100903142 n=1 Tax=Galendromus occidentalis TaxID=34638 RepID=A0AAJ6VZT2_9ACAR|nr:uncharacterized protein LOC100903142 [Galendromus occidentalis]
MQLKNGTKLRLFIFRQQGLIGIIQGILTLLLLQKKTSGSETWIAAITGGMNFVVSLVIVGHFGVQLDPADVVEEHNKAMLTIAAAVVGNFMALCLILDGNRSPELTRILTFREEGAPLQAFAVFFYLTVYVTLLLVIGLATYCLINVLEGGAISDAEDAKGKKEANAENATEVLVNGTANEKDGMRREDFFIETKILEDKEDADPDDRNVFRKKNLNRRTSSVSETEKCASSDLCPTTTSPTSAAVLVDAENRWDYSSE